MIAVTRLNGSELWLNPMLIEAVERTPDSVVTLTNGHRYVVRESPDEIVERMQAFFGGIGRSPATAGSSPLDASPRTAYPTFVKEG